MLASGVTACLPTVITAAEDRMAARLAALDAAVAGSRLGPLMVPGWHLEGPFLNPAPGFRGCHPAEAMRPPDPAFVERIGAGLRRPILLLTLAGELPGAEALIAWAAGSGRLVALGHSDAQADVVARAVAAGASLCTHLGNGLPHLLPKLDNPLMAQLAEDRLAAGFIADGVHLPVPALREAPPATVSELATCESRMTSSGWTMRPPTAAALPRNTNRRLRSICCGSMQPRISQFSRTKG